MLDPNNLLRGYALNNLAVACWWHKHPNFRDLEDAEESDGEQGDETKYHNSQLKLKESDYSSEQVEADFDNTIPLFKKALWYIQNVNEIEDKEKQKDLNILLDQDNIIPEEHQKFDPTENQILLKNKQCGIPLLNIQEFLFHTCPDLKTDAMFWFKYGLKFFEQIDPVNIDRFLITLGVFCNNYNEHGRAEQLFKKTLEIIGDNDNYNKVLCLQIYGNMLLKNLAREHEGQQLIAKAHELSQQLPFWFNKINHICIPKIELQ
ncbi:hypothetical protein IMG5_051660 [Ichthyophthirius multifiliis]|uniref:Tetratricopeptide repeat protein n=1 Tax=Ichthyophthirius multifiliis TaxID=5932 RepID=G0QMT5_ICHMU|nr:hypothetical protein IMG5_051660 [Ichthyophthirius multifiliis]EGR33488.1 hypothetical protein IMG5_051660 [Ichthyophthirius multifiliis]|eukprot:XP_004037474.1 hypothetical protein IMG5_051660 [Ichthyophthirius multifiliis]